MVSNKKTKRVQKGGTSLYGPTLNAMKNQASMGAGRGRIPHGPATSTCNASSPQRPSMPFFGGGLSYTKINGSGHRPILANPGYGYSNSDDNQLFKGSRPTSTSYNSSSCQAGGKKRRKKKTKRRTRKRKTHKKKKRRRKTKRKIKRRKRSRKRRVLRQKGGASVQYGFPGPIDKSLGDYRLWKGNGLTVKNNFNCPDTYNHFTK